MTLDPRKFPATAALLGVISEDEATALIAAANPTSDPHFFTHREVREESRSITITTVCPGCKGFGGLEFDRTGGMSRSCHFCDESGRVNLSEVPLIRAALEAEEQREADWERSIDEADHQVGERSTVRLQPCVCCGTLSRNRWCSTSCFRMDEPEEWDGGEDE